MTIINHSHSFIFIHVPKAAGTSVTTHLAKYTQFCDLEIGGTQFGEQIQRPYARRFGISKHSPTSRLRAMMGGLEWDRYFSFAVVRNPFARAYSTYQFLLKWEGYNAELRKQITAFKSFDDYVASDFFMTPGPDQMLNPQVFWLWRMHGERQLGVNFVGKLESLDADLAYIDKVINARHDRASALEKLREGLHANEKSAVTGSPVPQLNASTPLSKTAFKSKEIVERIRQRYKQDFEFFNYSPDPSAATAPSAK